ncbi:MAG: SPOR domain-containing protein [Cytophagaceae bacterium]|jgi:flagellar basal body-associated protein FliL|nr:SPOR domain-containing protein [Cytophagaceae bacterium]
MQQLNNILITLLQQHSCVVLPGFGAFLTEREGAWVHPVTQRLFPPRKRIAFNAQLVQNDGLLQVQVALELKLNSEQAFTMVQQYAQQVAQHIQQNKSYTFPEIGRCFLNKEGQLEFEPEKNSNLLQDSFGLPELFLKPIESTTFSMSQRPVRPVVRRPGNTNTTSENTNNDSLNSGNKEASKNPVSAGKVVLIIIPMFLLLGAGATLFYFKQNGKSLASLNPFGTEQPAPNNNLSDVPQDADQLADSVASETVINDTTSLSVNESLESEVNNEITTVIDAPSKSTLAEKQEELSKNSNTSNNKEGVGNNVVQQGRYFVVIGSFIDRDNAVKLRNKMAARGLNVTLIERSKESRFYKVAIDDFDNEEEAIRRKKELEGQFGNEVWIMSY